MALVAYLDWEVRTTGHDLNCSGFNPERDPTNGIDYTQQDTAEITSLNWVVDSTNNTWIRSQALTDWVNGGKTLASLKGNHIHIAGLPIGGTVLFSWVASTGKPGAYYLQASGGGNPSWTTKPARFWINKTFTLENTSLPAGSNTWAWGDFDTLGYSTIYVRLGAESDVSPATKAQDDIIADGKTWTRGAYEIIDVGTDANGPYLVLDRSPGAVGITNGYGRIGGAMASPGGVSSIASYQIIVVRPGTYYFVRVAGYNPTPGSPPIGSIVLNPGSVDDVNINGLYGGGQNDDIASTFINIKLSGTEWNNGHTIRCKLNTGVSTRGGSHIGSHAVGNYVRIYDRPLIAYCNLSNVLQWHGNTLGSVFFSIIKSSSQAYVIDKAYNSVFYALTGNPIINNNGRSEISSCVFLNCSGPIFGANCVPVGTNNFVYGITAGLGGKSLDHWSYTVLPGDPFVDSAGGDFRLADNEAGRMLKRAGFAIPGPSGMEQFKFDVGAVQNSFYDIQGSGGAVLPIPMMFGT